MFRKFFSTFLNIVGTWGEKLLIFARGRIRQGRLSFRTFVTITDFILLDVSRSSHLHLSDHRRPVRVRFLVKAVVLMGQIADGFLQLGRRHDTH